MSGKRSEGEAELEPEAPRWGQRLQEQFRNLSGRTVLFHEAVAERLGLRATDHKSLDLAAQAAPQQPITAGKLAELTGLTTGAITGVLDRLERAGFIQRAPGAEDRRQVVVRIIPTRAKEIGALFEPLGRGLGEITRQYRPEELALVSGFIEKCAALLEHETERLRSGAPRKEGPSAGYDLEAPLKGAARGLLQFVGGASSVELGSGSGDFFYRARFEGPAPKITTGPEEVTFHSAKSGFGRKLKRSRIELNQEIPWEIACSGGVSSFYAELSALPLSGLSISGGANAVELQLPPPRGKVLIRIRGGAHQVRLVRPRGSAVRVYLRGGANKVSLDRLELGAVGNELRWESPEFERAEDAYELELTGGANLLSLAAV